MSKRHVQNELSAYIDGEARHPDRIERHLSQCPDCARHHMELLKLSSHLGAMNGPDMVPAFLTRVMAHTREVDMLPARRLRLTGSPQWVAAIVLIMAGLALLYGALPNTGQSTAIPLDQVSVSSETDYLDDEAIIDAMAKFMDEGVDLTYLASDTSVDWLVEDNAITYDEMVALLAEEIAEEDVYLGGGSDVYGLIDGMETSEAVTLESLLTNYEG